MNIMNIKRLFSRIPLYIVITVSLVVTLYPLFWIFMTSIKPFEEQVALPPYALPRSPTFANYINLIDSMIPVYFGNSLIVAAGTIPLIVIFGALLSFPLSKMDFKGRRVIFIVIMTGLMLPFMTSLLPLFSVYTALGLRNTYWALIIPQVGFAIPVSMYLCMGFMEQMPNSIIESGYIDGASSFKIFRKIILPLMKNTIATIAIFQFVFVWNEFLFARTFISRAHMKTVPLGLNDFVDQYGLRDWGMTFAAVATTVLPTLIVFFVLNKHVMAGMTAGAVKGE